MTAAPVGRSTVTVTFVLAGLALGLAAPASALVGEPDDPFCESRVLRDFDAPLEGLPEAREPPAHLPFAPRRISLYAGSEGVVVGGDPIEYGLFLRGASYGSGQLGWEVESRLVQVDRDGDPLRLAKRKVERVGQSESARRGVIGFARSPGPGLYRYDLSFRKAGEPLGQYHDYYRVVRRSTEVLLRLNGTSFRPGDRLLAKLENPGTEWLAYGVGYQLERSEGGAWLPIDLSELFGHPVVFILIGIRAAPGISGTCATGFTVPETMSPGLYRMVKSVDMTSGPKPGYSQRRIRRASRYLTAEFTVEPPA